MPTEIRSAATPRFKSGVVALFCHNTIVNFKKTIMKEKNERKIVKHATNNGVLFEKAAIISRSIKQKGAIGDTYLRLLEKFLNELQKK